MTRRLPQHFKPFIPRLSCDKALASPTPESIILTGTAGDGKTYLCRKIWEALGGDVAVWQQDDKVRSQPLPSGRTLVVIKDLSELRDEANAHLTSMANAICGPASQNVFLIAANDGQLVDAWNRVPDSEAVVTVRGVIEDLLVGQQRQVPGYAVRLYNLSRTSAAETFGRILAAVLAHEGWEACRECVGATDDLGQRCPIWENYQRLQQPLFQERLRQLLELCDHNDYHLPVRQLLMLVSNILLGHPDGKDRLLRCADALRAAANGSRLLASPVCGKILGQPLVCHCLPGKCREIPHCLRTVEVPVISGKQCRVGGPRKQWHTQHLSPPGNLAAHHPRTATSSART